MTMAVLIWYPKCSTCQKAKKKLEALGVEVETRSIVEQTPTVEELRRWMAMGDLTLKQLYNVSGNLYKELNMKERRLQMSGRCSSAERTCSSAIVRRPMKHLQKRKNKKALDPTPGKDHDSRCQTSLRGFSLRFESPLPVYLSGCFRKRS